MQPTATPTPETMRHPSGTPPLTSAGLRPLALATFATATLALACGAEASTGPGEAGPGDELAADVADLRAITGVHVVHPEDGRVEENRTVLVRDGRIEDVGAAGEVTIPAGAAVLEGEGAWLMPGLLDMHIHMEREDADDYVRHGITTVRNMWGFVDLPSIVSDIESGALVGPRIHTLSPGVDAPPVHWPQTQLITDAAQADSVVQLQWERGYRELKIYQDLTRELYDAVLAEARERGMTFAGHKPGPVSLEHVIRSGQRSIEHLGGYVGLRGDALDEAVRLSVEHGTWVCPTLAVQLRLQGATSLRAERARVTKALWEGGVRLLVGTDAGIDATSPGRSLVEEMELFREAGVPLPDLLRMVTVDGAHYLGLADEIGAVAPGMRADLLLLSTNPLEDLDALRDPLGVLMGRRWIRLR